MLRDPGRDTAAPPTSRLVTRFWHPRDRVWNENYFETLEHAARLFVDESGWVLIQQQAVAGALAWELIFEARRADFARPSTDDILRDIGLSPEQGHVQGRSLRRREDVQDLVDDPVEEVPEGGEGQLRLGLGRSGREDAVRAGTRLRNGVEP